MDSTINSDTEILNNEETRGRFHPEGGLFRYTGLVLMCLIGFGSYFCYDGPGALQDNVQSDLKLTTSQFVLLYSWYSWPNVILCFVGGFLMDGVFGIRLGTSIFCTLIVIGQLVFASGALVDAFWLMVVGRFIFGIGAESLCVAQNNYAVLWFKGKELNMVFGLQLSFARLGSTVNFMVMETLYQWVSKFYKGYSATGITLVIAGITTIVSFISALLLGCMDKRMENHTQRRTIQNGAPTVKITDVKDFPVIFWMVCVICVAYYVAIFPFVALGKVFFERKFDLEPHAANVLTSIIYTISAVASPLLGYLVDLTGRNVYWVILSISVSIGAHSMLAFTFWQPYIGMCILGLAYSMLASGLWPMIALVIPEYQLGTAYGIAQSLQNLGLAVITMTAGMIVDKDGYVLLEVFFLCWLCVALGAAVVIWIHDYVNEGVLNMSIKERSRIEQHRKMYEKIERDMLDATESMAAVTPQDILQPHSDFHMRNRYLSRIGAVLPAHFSGGQQLGKTYRALR